MAVTLQQITDFGFNPTNLQMYIYVSPDVQAHPPILVVTHACHGPPEWRTRNEAPWPVNTALSLFTRKFIQQRQLLGRGFNGFFNAQRGGDPAGMVSMAAYVEQHYNGRFDAGHAAGYSSGGMMTNVLLGSYPDIFKAGTAFAGVAFGCFAAGSVDCYGSCLSDSQRARSSKPPPSGAISVEPLNPNHGPAT